MLRSPLTKLIDPPSTGCYSYPADYPLKTPISGKRQQVLLSTKHY